MCVLGEDKLNVIFRGFCGCLYYKEQNVPKITFVSPVSELELSELG